MNAHPISTLYFMREELDCPALPEPPNNIMANKSGKGALILNQKLRHYVTLGSVPYFPPLPLLLSDQKQSLFLNFWGYYKSHAMLL